jgi:2-polyprenyl-3-methyl-5-hydroxy-6-metoxy-1,4-benzoquinol methylase
MYERLDNCPLCNSGHFHNKVITKDYTVSGESFAIVECDNCKLNFTNPRPSQNDIKSFYESEDYISHSDKSHSIYDLAYRTVRYFTLKAKVRLVNNLNTKKKTILDYGCGTGNFLASCKKASWSVTGIEPNEKARAIATSETGEDIYANIDEIPGDTEFNIITLWHVLEHIHDLKEAIKLLKKRLKKNGYLILALPNNQSWDAQQYGEHWAGYDVPRHLYHFNPETVKKLAELHEMKIKRIVPQKMDAFYISLLSEKYMNGANNPYKAILNGFKSNNNASKNNQYSSLVYILRR